jgi:DNA-binding NtrC family response regulator
MGGYMRPESARTLLLIDADQAQHRLVATVASRAGWRVEAAQGPGAGASLANGGEIAALLLARWDKRLLEGLRSLAPGLPILVFAEASASVEAMRAGASDTLGIPLGADRLAAALASAADRRGGRGELRPLAQKISVPLGFDELVGSTPAFRAALAVAAKAARSRVPVLIEGERGSGKESIAQAIHASGPRSGSRMVGVDCGAVIPNLIESHLFGHEKGAFPGAFDRHRGMLEEAHGTTLFLDRIDELPLEIQSKLLHVLGTGEVERVGGQGFKSVDLRIIAASNRPLAQEMREGRFREDLYHGLAMVSLAIPPLRERRADIPALARHFLAYAGQQPGMRSLGITDEALTLLMGFGWPGNVRQLQDALIRAAIFCEGQALTSSDFPQIAQESTHSRRADDYHAPSQDSEARGHAPGITLYQADGHLRSLEEIEADVIRLAIGHYHGRMTEVARRLRIGRSTLYRKLVDLGISDAA